MEQKTVATPIWTASDLQFINKMGIDTFDLAGEEAERQHERTAALLAFYKQGRHDAFIAKLSWCCITIAGCAIWAGIIWAAYHLLHRVSS